MYYTYMYLEDCHSERLDPPLVLFLDGESDDVLELLSLVLLDILSGHARFWTIIINY